MTPIQQLLLGVGAKKKTYIDDVFSTFLYKGNESSTLINNSIDLSGEGGLVWSKRRDGSSGSRLLDTVRGVTKWLTSESNAAEGTDANSITAFNNNGFTVGTNTHYNGTGDKYASWTFRKAPGFFDIVTYTGNYDDTGSASTQTISHNLGCVPGCIIIKQTSGNRNWIVYHKDSHETTPEGYRLQLSDNFASTSTSTHWNNTKPTSTSFQVGAQNHTNEHNETYVAYLFAGGESTATTANSTDFTGSVYLTVPASSDLDPGSGDFTIETWFKLDDDATGSYYRMFSKGFGQQLQINSYRFKGWFNSVDNNNSGTYDIALASKTIIKRGQWYHGAITRSGNMFRLFLNGIEEDSQEVNFTIATTSYSTVVGSGDYGSITSGFDGSLSNFRYVKGTAVYTESFRPPTAPLTNITNTKLLFCNSSSSATATTVSPGTITSSGGVNPNSNSPFDDPAGFKFGDSGDQNAIKCGSYVGNGSSTGPEVELGWEPQWLMIKSTADGTFWLIFDSMRGIVDNEESKYLYANDNNNELSDEYLKLTPTGFQITNTNGNINTNHNTYTYIAIRRSDGYIGKPADAGTDVFNVVAGIDSGSPNYVTNFVTDMSIWKLYASSGTWWQAARLTGQKYMSPDVDNAENTNSNYEWDFMNGWYVGPYTLSTQMGWHFRRHSGFDIVTYKGNGESGRRIPHSLSKTPEMMWVKRRNDTQGWFVYHKGLNGGSDPADKYLEINESSAEADDQNVWWDTMPTATAFTVGNSVGVNGDGDNYTAMLFSSVSGISKVGYYDGSDSAQTITTGFQPRFLIVKNITESSSWNVVDTTRGWASGNDQRLFFDFNGAQAGADDLGAPTSTGFTLTGDNYRWNEASKKYIYYAHA